MPTLYEIFTLRWGAEKDARIADWKGCLWPLMKDGLPRLRSCRGLCRRCCTDYRVGSGQR